MRMLKAARPLTLLIAGVLLSLVAASVFLLRTGGWSRRDRGPNRSQDPANAHWQHGRFDRGFALVGDGDQPQSTAERCAALGQSLIERERIVLGWAALEAARRLDGKHPGAIRGLDELGARLARATGRERAQLQEAVRRRELLCAIPGGRELGVFVLGLASHSSDAQREQDFFDRLTVLDRAVLHNIKTVAGANKLLARLLLAMGRAAEAGALLEPLVDASRAAPDREAAWLLSRVALQRDQTETADLMLALAGDYGENASAGREPAPFVGSRRCGDCHRRLYREQQSASRHALTLRFGADLKDVPLPDKPVPDPIIPAISHGFARNGAGKIELETRALDRVIKAVVAYAVGSGRHGITMIGRDDEGALRELRVSYFGQGQTWGQTKGIDFAPRDAGDHVGMALAPAALDHCLHCHTTWFRSVISFRDDADAPAARDHGIGCERCHGPGFNHVKAVETGFAETAIALSSSTPPRARLRSCVECHAADGSVQPSDPEFTRAQGTTLLFSRCYTRSSDRFDCTTCHDPHRVLDTTAAHYEAKCLSCHSSGSRSHESAALARGPSCPVNATAKCITCHMPKVDDPSRHSRFTDHHIRVHREGTPISATERSPPSAKAVTAGVPPLFGASPITSEHDPW